MVTRAAAKTALDKSKATSRAKPKLQPEPTTQPKPKLEARTASKAKPASGAKEADGQSSAERMLGLLDLFTPAASVRQVAELVSYLGTSRSTSYRYIRALHAAGLIEPVANGRYVLGSRITEFDRQIRMTDPMYKGGGPVLETLVERTGHSALLCTLSSDSVMCTREELTQGSPARLFSRGQRRPLLAGAMSKVILPFLPPHRLRSIFQQHQRAIALAGLGTDWAGFRESLATTRKDGFIVTYGEFNPGVFGVAAPVFNAEGLIVGSIGIAGSEERLDRKKLPSFCQFVVDAGKRMSDVLADESSGLVRPPRAYGSNLVRGASK